MRKYIYLLASCLLFSQPIQAGKYFDVKDDGHTIFFKKSGHKFNGALNHVLNHAKSHKIQKVSFHENVSEEQKNKVIATLSERLNVVDMGNGLLEDATTYKVMKDYLNFKKTRGLVFKEDISLDLRQVTSETQSKYLPSVHKMIDGMDQVATLHFTMPDFTLQMLGPLKVALAHNQGIKHIFFHDNYIFDSPYTTNITKIIPDLLLVKRPMKYYFSLHSLSALSTNFLDKTLNGLTVEKLQQNLGQKSVVSLVTPYVGNCYDTSEMQNYKEVCQSQYGLIFKASYADYMDEQEQGTLLLEMLNEMSVKIQLGKIDEILKREKDDKDFPIYLDNFKEIKNILTAQVFSQDKSHKDYLALENQKIDLINGILTRIGLGKIFTSQ